MYTAAEVCLLSGWALVFLGGGPEGFLAGSAKQWGTNQSMEVGLVVFLVPGVWLESVVKK